ncbi:response regulator [Streptomyces sp. NPDC056486]|uniref:response regulator n=1 Tax=Streptomyces sp. NPDC056486 TaxID=3345835 RepID=UPI00369BC88B
MTAEKDERTRVLLADDEPLVRAGLSMLLHAEDDLVIVGELGDATEAVEQAAQLRPNVIVMDVRMPPGTDGGVEATRRLTDDAFIDNTGYTPAVLVLTSFNDDEAVYAALRAGASGFMLKHAAPSELVAAIRAVANGHAWLHPAVTRKLLNDFATRPRLPLPTLEEMQRLTPREREVLALVAHGFSNDTIAEYLVLARATVRTHLGRILVKLGLDSRAQAVAAAYKSGLVRPDDQPPSQPTRRP